jgi:hypothetical protein
MPPVALAGSVHTGRWGRVGEVDHNKKLLGTGLEVEYITPVCVILAQAYDSKLLQRKAGKLALLCAKEKREVGLECTQQVFASRSSPIYQGD